MQQANVYSYRFLYFKNSSNGQYELEHTKETSYIHDAKEVEEIKESECCVVLNNKHTVTKFCVVQLITPDEVYLDKHIPPFTVLRKPSLLVAAKLIYEGMENLSECYITKLEKLDKVNCAICLLSADQHATVFLVPMLRDLSLMETIDTLYNLLVIERKPTAYIPSLLDEISNSMTGKSVEELAENIKLIQSVPTEQVANYLETHGNYASVIEHAEQLENKISGTLLFYTDEQLPFVIEHVDYSHDQVMLKCNYITSAGVAKKRPWSKLNSSAIRFLVNKGLPSLPLKIVPDSELSEDGVKKKRHNGIFIDPRKTAQCPYGIDFTYYLYQLYKPTQHLQQQIHYYHRISTLEYCTNNKLLLRSAFTHSTYSETKQLKGSSNERIEYLGDAIIQLVAAEYVYRQTLDDEQSYDYMEATRYLCCNKYIHKIAIDMNLIDYMLYSTTKATILKSKTMSDTFEAVVGAIFLDQGFNEARSFLYKYLFPSDFKSFIEAYKVDEKIAYGVDFIYDPTKLPYKFKNKSLIDTFFTIIDEKPLLKYIGISLLRFLAVEHVFLMFPTASESQMTLSHHAIINQHEVCVIEAINKLGLNSCKDPRQDSTICLHAFLGAVYLDNDANMETFFVDNTRRHDLKGLVHPNVMSTFNVTPRLQPHMIQKPQKTILQHLCQVKCGSIPVYQTTEVEQGWRVSILLDEKIIAEAIHKDSRQATEQAVINGIALYSK